MSLIQAPFRKYNENGKIDSFSVRLNNIERAELNTCKRILLQPKDSTALKTLAHIGAIVLQDQKTTYIISTLFKNKSNNQRTGNTEIG